VIADRATWRARWGTCVLACGLWIAWGIAVSPAGASGAGTSEASAAEAKGRAESPDASSLYNAGTVALGRGDLGAAVTFLTAAARLEPRASDIQANLRVAAGQVARLRGDDERAAIDDAMPFPVAPLEAWWLAAGILALACGLGIAKHLGVIPRVAAPAIIGALSLGIGLSAWLHLAAWNEARHPEAVVIVPTLSVERGPDEPSRPAVLLSAGERVRLGRSLGDLVEIRFGGNPIGWSPGAGLWRVADAPRYTARFHAE